MSRLLALNDYESAFPYIKELADNFEDPQASFYAAKLLIKGAEGVDKDIESGLKYLKTAQEEEVHGIFNFLGILYEDGLKLNDKEFISPDLDKAFEYFSKGAEKGESYAKYNLGRFYYQYKKTPENIDKAAKIFLEFAREGDAKAKRLLLEIALDLRDSSDEKGIKYLENLVDLGYRGAMNFLALSYSKGIGVAQNHQKAEKLYKLAIKKGYHLAKFNLALLYHQNQKTAKAIPLLKGFRERFPNNSNAPLILGSWYELGEGISQDLHEALVNYKEAAKINSQDAVIGLYRLGDKFLEIRDFKNAKDAFRAAAEHGDVKASDALKKLDQITKQLDELIAGS